VAGGLSLYMSGLDAYRNIDLRSDSKNKAGTTSFNTPSSPVSFPLGLHALPLGSLDRAWPQAEPMSPFEKRVAQHTSTHPIIRSVSMI